MNTRKYSLDWLYMWYCLYNITVRYWQRLSIIMSLILVRTIFTVLCYEDNWNIWYKIHPSMYLVECQTTKNEQNIPVLNYNTFRENDWGYSLKTYSVLAKFQLITSCKQKDQCRSIQLSNKMYCLTNLYQFTFTVNLFTENHRLA